MTPEEINSVLEANPQAAALLLREFQTQFPMKTTEELRALAAEEILARTQAPESAVDRMQTEAS